MDSRAVVYLVSLRVLLGALVGWVEQPQQDTLAHLIEGSPSRRGQLRGRRPR